jgi:hypothetical protein
MPEHGFLRVDKKLRSWRLFLTVKLIWRSREVAGVAGDDQKHE